MTRALITIPMVMLVQAVGELKDGKEKPDFTIEEVYLITTLFKIMMADKIDDLATKENYEEDVVISMAEKSKKDLHNYIRVYTGIDIESYIEEKKKEYEIFLQTQNN